LEGLIYDLERRVIAGVIPRPDVLSVLQLVLGHAWELRDGGLWRRNREQFPVRDLTRRPPPTPFALSPEQQREAIALVRFGKTLRAVGQVFGVSYGATWRLIRSDPHGRDTQQAEDGKGGEAQKVKQAHRMSDTLVMTDVVEADPTGYQYASAIQCQALARSRQDLDY
jgi:hypothetical protein